MFDALHAGKAKYSSIFNYPTLNWSDMGTAGGLERVLVGDGPCNRERLQTRVKAWDDGA